jgi:hypothetical protein
MTKSGGEVHSKVEKSDGCDLACRLARYRSRLEAEGRLRSVELIDRAIRDAQVDVVRRTESAPPPPQH